MRVKISRNQTKNFRYLWLKKVTGTNLSQHCAKCLKGSYNKIINRFTRCETLELDDGIYYLCGVSQPYKWENNAHIAFRAKPGSNFEYENNGLKVEAIDAELIPISDRYVPDSLAESSKKEYYTCRNWQFAHWYRKEYNR